MPINLFCTTPILSVANNSATWFSENKEVDLSISKNCSTSTFFKENFEILEDNEILEYCEILENYENLENFEIFEMEQWLNNAKGC